MKAKEYQNIVHFCIGSLVRKISQWFQSYLSLEPSESVWPNVSGPFALRTCFRLVIQIMYQFKEIFLGEYL